MQTRETVAYQIGRKRLVGRREDPGQVTRGTSSYHLVGVACSIIEALELVRENRQNGSKEARSHRRAENEIPRSWRLANSPTANPFHRFAR